MESYTLMVQDSELQAALLQRGESENAIVQRDLKRYYSLLKHSLSDFYFSIDEAILICEALSNYQFDSNLTQPEMVWIQVNDAIQHDRLTLKPNVDPEILLNQLKTLTALQTAALIDAVEQFWLERRLNPQASLHETLHQVSLIDCCNFAQ